MPDADFVPRIFLWCGGVLILFGLALTSLIGLTMFPPYVITGLLALGYGYYCRREARRAVGGKS